MRSSRSSSRSTARATRTPRPPRFRSSDAVRPRTIRWLRGHSSTSAPAGERLRLPHVERDAALDPLDGLLRRTRRRRHRVLREELLHVIGARHRAEGAERFDQIGNRLEDVQRLQQRRPAFLRELPRQVARPRMRQQRSDQRAGILRSHVGETANSSVRFTSAGSENHDSALK